MWKKNSASRRAKRGNWTALSLALATVVALAAAPVGAQQTPVVLKASPLGPQGHLLNRQILAVWADRVTAATEGRVKVEMLPAPIAPPAAIFSAIEAGKADLGLMPHGAAEARLSLNALVEFSGQTPSAEQTSVAYQRVVQRYPALGAEFDGVELLGVFTHGPGVILLNGNGARQRDDFAKLTLHAGGAAAEKTALSLGAKTIGGPAPAAAARMGQGAFDGMVTPIESFIGFGLIDSTEAVVRLPGGFYNSGFSLIANSARWSGLSGADRAAIKSVSGEAFARLAGAAWDVGDATALRRIRAMGIPVVDGSGLAPKLMAANELRKKAWIERAGVNAADASNALAEYHEELGKR